MSAPITIIFGREVIVTIASRITLWGQSAGAASTDINNFAFYEDPIVTGFFAQSGTASLLSSTDASHSNFTFVASQLGCDYPDDATKELKCMRKVPAEDITAFVGAFNDNGTLPLFYPVPDDKIVFSNYTDRYIQGKVSPQPAIFSTTEQEGTALVPYQESGVNETFAQFATLALLCPVAQTSLLREAAGLTTYRYLYSGDFPNVSPLPWMDAYHASDLPMLFATHQDYTNGKGKSTPLEYKVSERMEDLLYAFMIDPEHGPEKHKWAPYTSGQMLQFGADGKVMQNVSIASVEAVCASFPAR